MANNNYIMNYYNCLMHGWLLNVNLCRFERKKKTKGCGNCKQFKAELKEQRKVKKIYYKNDRFKCKKLKAFVTGSECITRVQFGGPFKCTKKCKQYKSKVLVITLIRTKSKTTLVRTKSKTTKLKRREKN